LTKSKKDYVGILGGTFDPPHQGHLFISKFAKIKLDLGEVWWVINSSNPFKKRKIDYKKKIQSVREFLKNQKIKIFEIEDFSKSVYTIDLLKILFDKYPQKKFVWLMGVDNLEEFHLWKNWKEIFCNIPIAIFDRPFYSLNISNTKAISHFKDSRINKGLSKQFKYMKPPKWIFISGLTHKQSSTKIRYSKFVRK
tara:strand:+ start:3554 stop:4138 length:585 start_codon:yes stop_codon:yes gene_type:complete